MSNCSFSILNRVWIGLEHISVACVVSTLPVVDYVSEFKIVDFKIGDRVNSYDHRTWNDHLDLERTLYWFYIKFPIVGSILLRTDLRYMKRLFDVNTYAFHGTITNDSGDVVYGPHFVHCFIFQEDFCADAFVHFTNLMPRTLISEMLRADTLPYNWSHAAYVSNITNHWNKLIEDCRQSEKQMNRFFGREGFYDAEITHRCNVKNLRCAFQSESKFMLLCLFHMRHHMNDSLTNIAISKLIKLNYSDIIYVEDSTLRCVNFDMLDFSPRISISSDDFNSDYLAASCHKVYATKS